MRVVYNNIIFYIYGAHTTYHYSIITIIILLQLWNSYEAILICYMHACMAVIVMMLSHHNMLYAVVYKLYGYKSYDLLPHKQPWL